MGHEVVEEPNHRAVGSRALQKVLARELLELVLANAQLADDVVQYASVQQTAACVLKNLALVVGRGDAFVPQLIFSVYTHNTQTSQH